MHIHQSTNHSNSHRAGTPIGSDLRVRPADQADLAVINNIVITAIDTWGLAQRVHRLAQRSLAYTRFDLEYMRMVLGENETGDEIATALWELEADVSNNFSSILLHGIYVLPGYQRCGVGVRMIEHVMNIAKKDGIDRIAVKAWRGSEEFFLKLGFNSPQDAGRKTLYPRRLWKAV